MKMLFKSLAVVLISSLAFLGSKAIASSYEPQKVVYHVNYADDNRYRAMLGNIQNHINGVGLDKVEIQVVMHGPGIDLLQRAHTDEVIQSRIMNLKGQGVEFKICANTLVGRNVNVGQLFDASQADIVPSGVAEIAALQQRGFVYLRP